MVYVPGARCRADSQGGGGAWPSCSSSENRANAPAGVLGIGMSASGCPTQGAGRERPGEASAPAHVTHGRGLLCNFRATALHLRRRMVPRDTAFPPLRGHLQACSHSSFC